MTDISANIFALLILLLIILLVGRESSPLPHSETPTTIDVQQDLMSVERSPLGSNELFDLFYERRKQSTSIRIDLLGDGIDIISIDKEEHFSSIESATPRLSQLAVETHRSPVGIYVFSNRYYRGVSENMQALGWTWREVSVPEALRDLNPQSESQRWSTGFSDLIAQPSDRLKFRTQLAELLQSSARNAERSNARQQSANAASNPMSSSVLKTLERWSRMSLHVLAVLSGLGFIAWVELRRKREVTKERQRFQII